MTDPNEKADPAIRVLFQENGKVKDYSEEHELSLFGGVVPNAGDVIVNPGVLQGKDRTKLENRDIWTVVRRVFNPKDNGGSYIALVVETRQATEEDEAYV
jgi:hypothetical protein